MDVFFVLSGFLITGIIYRELRTTGRVSLSNFYARRARRLLPAAGLVLLVTLVASILLLPAFRHPSVSADIASAGVYLSNMRFGSQANDYFQATTAPSPVLHFWSLSVEEQFYIFWPALLILMHNLFSSIGSPRGRVAGWIIVIGSVSLAASVALTAINQPWAFFLLPTRAWELAVGALIAVMARRLVSIPNIVAAACTVVGVGAVLAAAFVFDDATAFPGVAAIVPVTGSGLVIIGGMPLASSLASRALAVPPLRYIGRISYSLYLWHWPILLFGLATLGPSMALPLVLLTFPVAAASQRFIEEPFRLGRFIGTHPSQNLLQAAAIGILVAVASSALAPTSGGGAPIGTRPSARPIATSNGATGSPASAAPSDIANQTARPSTAGPGGSGSALPSGLPLPVPAPCPGCTLADVTPPLEDLSAGLHYGGCNADDLGDTKACVLGRAASKVSVALLGDSHAENWVPAFEALAVSRGWRFVALTTSECPAATATIWAVTLKRASPECNAWRDLAFARLDAEKPTLIVLSGWSRSILIDTDGRRLDVAGSPDRWSILWSEALARTFERLAPTGAAFVVLGDVPTPIESGLDPATCLAQHPSDLQACAAPREQSVAGTALSTEASSAAAHGAKFIDPTSWLCDAERCPAVIDRFVVYRDFGGHITAPFVMSLTDRLGAEMPPLQ